MSIKGKLPITQTRKMDPHNSTNMLLSGDSTSSAQPLLPQQTPSHKPKPKPSLKLNMKGSNSPASRSLSSMVNTLPNFNHSGPFSPGLVTSRRVWIRRPNETATTIFVNQHDIIDDLKSAVLTKFPNSLAKFFDPADITIKIFLNSRKQMPANSTSVTNSGQPSKRVNIWSQQLSPESSKLSESPVASTFKEAAFQEPGLSTQQNTSSGFIDLEPDQNVWHLLDVYFPGGTNMNDAFIIETPIIDEQIHTNANFYRRGNPQLSELYQTSASPSNHRNQTYHSYDRSLTPNSASSIPNFYHQPKPQYGQKSHTLYNERSVSPANHVGSNFSQNIKSSPVPVMNLHKRSHSNPSQLPMNNLIVNPKHASVGSIPGNASTITNNAVLLLPKNFSLPQETVHSVDKKSLTPEEDFGDKDDIQLKHSSSAKNVSNLNDNDDIQSSASFPRLLETNTDESSAAKSDVLSIPSTASLSQSDETGISHSLKNISNDKNIGEMKHNEESNGANSTDIINQEAEVNTEIVRKSPNPKKNATKTNTTIETVLPSISVLVVEDNAINQAILGAFLRRHKIHYQIAKNGQEAVAKWRNGGFHLVLMDIQLPVKSGIEATKEIRHLERVNRIGVFAENELTGPNSGPNSLGELSDDEKLDLDVFRSPVIIVALTASSNASVDRSNALRAGCNDYLTKPVNLVWLQNKITEWGCMQALIDFDGWKTKRSNYIASAQMLALNSRCQSRSHSKSRSRSDSQRQQKQVKT